MAKKAATRRPRRSTEQRLKELQEQIEALKNRAKAKELKTSLAHKLLLNAVRMLDKSLAAAKEEGNSQMAHALADGRNPLEAYLNNQGMALPKTRRPRGPRPKRG